MEVEAWQLKEIKEALKMADSKGAKFIDHKRVCEWISSWGSENEKKRSDFLKVVKNENE